MKKKVQIEHKLKDPCTYVLCSNPIYDRGFRDGLRWVMEQKAIENPDQ